MKKERPHNWKKAQPHHAGSGRITTRNFAKNHPKKVTWVTDKTQTKTVTRKTKRT